jgi:fatty acid desaturase
MHDAAHGRLFDSRAWNDRVGQLLCAGPVLLPLYAYKRGHLKHHQNPLAPGDPDLPLIGGYPAPRGKLARKLLQDLSGLSYFKFLKFFAYLSKRQERAVRAGEDLAGADHLGPFFARASIVGVNLALFAALSAAGHPLLYVLLWMIPSMTVLQAYLRVRGLAEHAGYKPGPDQSRNARTVVNPAQTFFVAPHNVNYHVEHHLYPGVPFFRLPELHRLLRARGALPPENVFRGYGRVLASLVT